MKTLYYVCQSSLYDKTDELISVGVSMVTNKDSKKLLSNRLERLENDHPEYNILNYHYDIATLDDGMIIDKLHVYLTEINDKYIYHYVFTAWPVEIE